MKQDFFVLHAAGRFAVDIRLARAEGGKDDFLSVWRPDPDAIIGRIGGNAGAAAAILNPNVAGIQPAASHCHTLTVERDFGVQDERSEAGDQTLTNCANRSTSNLPTDTIVPCAIWLFYFRSR